MKIRAAGIRKCDEFERTRTRLQPLNTCSAANSWPISVLKTDTNSYKGQQTHARKLSSAKSHTHRAEARISSNFCLEITSKMLPCTAKVEIPPPKLINFSLKAFFSFNKHAQPLSCAPTSGNRLHGGHSEWKSANSPTPPSTFSDLKAFLGSKKKTKFGPPYAAHSLFEPIFGSDIVTGVQAALPVAAKRGQPAGYTCFVVESIIYTQIWLRSKCPNSTFPIFSRPNHRSNYDGKLQRSIAKHFCFGKRRLG